MGQSCLWRASYDESNRAYLGCSNNVNIYIILFAYELEESNTCNVAFVVTNYNTSSYKQTLAI
jgi:hypothetical protein